MAKKNEPTIKVAYVPALECRPVIQDVPESEVAVWMEGLLSSKELIIRYTVLGGIMMVCKKHDDNDRYNWIGSCIYLHNRDECIGGDVFLCRVDFHKQPDGKTKFLDLRPYDIRRINDAADRIFQNHKRLEIEL